MSALSLGPLPAFVAAWADMLRSASCRVTRPVVATTATIAAALGIWGVYEVAIHKDVWGGALPIPVFDFYMSVTVVNLVMAFALMYSTFVADECVARGARRHVAYPLAVIVGSLAGALLQRALHYGLHLASRYDGPDMPHEMSVMQPAVVFFEYLIWGSILVFIYVNRRIALQASARMNQAQVEQARARRRTLESRLQALQARVEPQFLFNTLARVRALYGKDSEKGGRLLEDLIVYLRAALPHLRDSMSTLGKEIDLVSAYLSIMRAHLGDRLVFDGETPLPAATRDAVFPPMILLPLIDHVLVLSGSAELRARPTVRIDARAVSKRLRVEVSASLGDRGVAGDGRVLIDLRDRLKALYGDLATLVVEPFGISSTRVTMEIPYESADRDHR